jgi:hypothetical protein
VALGKLRRLRSAARWGVLCVAQIESEPDSGPACGAARLFPRTEQADAPAHTRGEPGLRAAAQTPISWSGAHLGETETSLQAACCQSYR